MSNRIKNLYIAVTVVALTGCASLQTTVQNDSSREDLSGKDVFVKADAFFDQNPTDAPFVGTVKQKAVLWLKAKGFNVVDDSVDAHTVVWLTAYANQKTVTVPGRSYTTPTYNFSQPETYKTTVKDQYGQNIGTLETQKQTDPYSPTGYQTNYVGPSERSVLDEGLAMNVYRQEYGTKGQKISSGVASYTEYGESIFTSESRIASAVSNLLAKTQLSSNKISDRVPSSDKKPGCYSGMGFSWDAQTALLTNVIPDSGAEKAELMPGDKLYSVNGKLFDAWVKITNPTYPRGTQVSVVVIRNGKEVKSKVLIGDVCAHI